MTDAERLLGSDSSEKGLELGYIKLWRKFTDSDVFDDPYLWKVFCWCMRRAANKPCVVEFSGEIVELDKGQFVTGRHSASRQLKMHESRVYRLMHELEKREMVNIKSNNRFSVVTLYKWRYYQCKENPFEQQVEQNLFAGGGTPPLQVGGVDENMPKTIPENGSAVRAVNTKKKDLKKKREERGVASAPPPLPEILEYMKSINCPHPDRNAEKFEAHYTSNGWKQNKGKPIIDWKAAARGWKLRQEEYEAENPHKAETNEEKAKRIAKEIKEGK